MWWQYNPADPKASLSLATLVTWDEDEKETNPLLAGIVVKARLRLGRETAGRLTDFRLAIDSRRQQDIKLAIECLYIEAREALGDIRYAQERDFDPFLGEQRVLSPDGMLMRSDATCLDLALLGVSLVAQVGFKPLVIVLVVGECAHAVAAVHLSEPPATLGPLPRLSAVLSAIRRRRMLAFECTGLVTGCSSWPTGLTFREACAKALRKIRHAVRGTTELPPWMASVCVDVTSAWLLGYHPNTISKLREKLKPRDFLELVGGRAREFIGRGRLLEEIAGWLRNPNSDAVFWIVGEPGMGKTAIAAHVCVTHSRVLAACHFCSRAYSEASNAGRVAKSLAFMLSERSSAYHEWLNYIALDDLLNHAADAILGELLDRGVEVAYRGSGMPRLIVIDALDEETDGVDLARFIGSLPGRLAERLPKLRFLVTSRPVPQIMRMMESIQPHFIDATDAGNVDDIRQYLTLKTQTPNGSALPKDTIDQITLCSEGVFAYAALVLDEIERTGSWKGGLPKGIGGIYRRILESEFPDFERYRNIARPLLEITLGAPAAVPRALVSEAAALDIGDLAGAVEQLWVALDSDSDSIQARHAFFTEWITDGNRKAASSLVIDLKRGQEQLARTCLRYVNDRAFPHWAYCVSHLPYLLCATRSWKSLVALLLNNNLRLVERWIDQGDIEAGLHILEALIKSVGDIETEDPLLSAGLATQIARLQLIRGEYDEAERWAKGVLDATAAFSGGRLRALALHELASLELYRGRHAAADDLFRSALRISLKEVCHDEAAANFLGLATLAMGRHSVRYGLRALWHARLAMDYRHLASAERIVAESYKLLGEFGQAAKHLEQARRVVEEQGIGLERARVLLETASLTYWRESAAGRPPASSRVMYEEALQEANRCADFYSRAKAEIGLGCCALAEEATEEAADRFLRLSGYLDGNSDRDLAVAIRLGLACVSHQKGELRIAHHQYKDVIKRCSALPNWLAWWRTRALVGLGAIEFHLGRTKTAQHVWDEALGILAQYNGAHLVTLANIARCRTSAKNVPA